MPEPLEQGEIDAISADADRFISELDEESGFGSGLRAAIERRHQYRRDFLGILEVG